MILFSRYFFILLLFVSCPYLAAQEEFFGSHNGLSIAGSKLNPWGKDDIYAGGMSAYFKSGVGVSLGVGGDGIPMASVYGLGRTNKNVVALRPLFGLAYAYADNNHLVGLQTGLFLCFFMKSQFPFSLNGVTSILAGGGTISEPVFDVGFTQAFFARSRLYPVAHVSYVGGIGFDYGLSLGAGLNLRLGKMEE